MLFYAVLPVLLLTVCTTFATFVVVVTSVEITYAARTNLHAHYEASVIQYVSNWANFSFGANLCFFALGMYALRLARQIDNDSTLMQWYIPVFLIVLLGVVMFAEPISSLLRWKGDPLLRGAGLAVLCLWQSARPSLWCANGVFEYVGERSYSVYLLHPIVIVLLKNSIRNLYASLALYVGPYAYFACVLMVLLPLLVLSEISYRLIEIPSIRFGKKINSRMRERAAQVAPQVLNNSAKHLA